MSHLSFVVHNATTEIFSATRISLTTITFQLTCIALKQ